MFEFIPPSTFSYVYHSFWKLKTKELNKKSDEILNNWYSSPRLRINTKKIQKNFHILQFLVMDMIIELIILTRNQSTLKVVLDNLFHTRLKELVPELKFSLMVIVFQFLYQKLLLPTKQIQ